MVKIKKVTREGSYYHVRYRSPGQFGTIRTPEWANDAAASVSKGARVRMGRTSAGNWLVQSVLLTPRGVRDHNHARSLASRIRAKIED